MKTLNNYITEVLVKKNIVYNTDSLQLYKSVIYGRYFIKIDNQNQFLDVIETNFGLNKCEFLVNSVKKCYFKNYNIDKHERYETHVLLLTILYSKTENGYIVDWHDPSKKEFDDKSEFEYIEDIPLNKFNGEYWKKHGYIK